MAAVCAVLFVIIALWSDVASSEYVNRKLCRNVRSDQSKCSVHSVQLDPCPDAPGFCLLRRGKAYALRFDFTPRFEAEKLMLSVHSDEDRSGNFSTALRSALDVCSLDPRVCPLQDRVRTRYDVDFAYDKSHERSKKNQVKKFPIQVTLWNEMDQSEACCFTFNVKTLK